MTRLLTVIGALVLLSSAVACDSARQSEALQPHVERSGPAGPVPPGLERYYGQELSWGPCAQYATTPEDRASYQDPGIECARLTVPMDYTRPQGKTVTLGLLREPAADPAKRIGSLVLNPGGPGASGMSTAASLASSFQGTELGNRFDLVGFDPRGIASSTPQVRCLSGPERDAERLDSDSNSAPGGITQNEREEQDYAAKCAQRSGPDLLAHVGTRDVVKDLDVLRSVLGNAKLTYLGYSYGTQIGSEYAEEFPGNVRAMVLDGAIDPGQNTVESQVSQAGGFQRAFDQFANWCAKQDTCALGPDPRHAVAAFQRLTRPLVRHPVPAGADRRLSYDDASTAAIQALYAPDLWEKLRTGLAELAKGRGDTLISLADSYYGRAENGEYSTVTDAFDAVRCVDDQRVMNRAEVRAADQRYRQAAPFLDDGHGASGARDMCAFWPVPVTGEQDQPKVGPLPPTLIISTTGDPATPYQAGKELAAALRGRLLTYEGTQHTVFLQGNACVDRAGTRYLVDLALPPPGTRCSA